MQNTQNTQNTRNSKDIITVPISTLIQSYAKLQSQKACIRNYIRIQEEIIAEFKKEKKVLWEACEPSNPSTQIVFDCYSEANNIYKQAKKEIKTLVSIQSTIKAQMRFVSSIMRSA